MSQAIRAHLEALYGPERAAPAYAQLAATLAELWPKRDQKIPLKSPAEAVILASIVEKETGQKDERARVAGVFYNRMRQGM
nr:endolytic transglycosylase MltG [Kouleothrix sp.]